MSLLLRSLLSAAIALALIATGAHAASTPWPPREGPGHLFVHYGEEHWNDDDGLTLLPKTVEDSARYKPALVTMSGDKDNNGTVEELTKWREIMSAYDRAGVPYLAGVGNHDRYNAPPNQPGFPPGGSITNYLEVFKDRPWPMGDAKPYSDPNFQPRERPASDPPGAATHYSIDYDNVRWIFVDNSCWDITFCSTNGQNPADGDTRSQLAWLESRALEATRSGKVVFVVMHMPTRDPRDQTYSDPTSLNHTMGKGATATDIADFERIASATEVDGVFVAHIKGQFQYRAQNVPYYIDGGAGGELYTEGPVGTDHGYWHGYRLLRVNGRDVTTDSVPIFVPGSLKVNGPSTVQRGAGAQFEGFGAQPVYNDPAKVPALELRDPDPVPPGGSAGSAVPPAVLLWGGPVVAFLLLGAALSRPRGRRRLTAALVPGLAGAVAVTGLAIAQRSEPTSTPKESLPNPARIWTSSNPYVLSPSPSGTEDPRRDVRTQTHDGKFVARCPGRATVRLTSGWESKGHRVVVPSQPGDHLRSLGTRARSLRAGRGATLAKLRLAQRAEVEVRVLRGSKRVATPLHRCLADGRGYSLRWDGRTGSKKAKAGAYRLEVLVRSERKRVVRRLGFRVTR
ncbi:MAG TPA: hypothetical protein VF715_18665 [Thermoleophilaceae bacterium]